MKKDQHYYYKKCRKHYQKLLEISVIIILIGFIMLFYSFKSFPDDYVRTGNIYSPETVKVIKIERTEQKCEKPKAERPSIPPDNAKVEAVEEPMEKTDKEPEIKTDIKLSYATAIKPPELPLDYVPYHLCDAKPELIKSVKPEYPEMLRKAGVEGYVVVKALVDTKGDVEKYEFLKSNELFNEAVVNVIKQFKFKPGKQRDRLVKVWMTIPFYFRLH